MERHQNKKDSSVASKSATGHGWGMLNKVPEVTIFFWIIKIMATTVGETAADLLNEKLNLGLTYTSIVMGVLLIITLYFQFRARSMYPKFTGWRWY